MKTRIKNINKYFLIILIIIFLFVISIINKEEIEFIKYKKQTKESLEEIYKLTYTLSPFLDEEGAIEFTDNYKKILSLLPDSKNYLDLYNLQFQLIASINDNHSFFTMSEVMEEELGYLPLDFVLKNEDILVNNTVLNNSEIKKDMRLIEYNGLNIEKINEKLEYYSRSKNNIVTNDIINLIRLGNYNDKANLKFEDNEGNVFNKELTFTDNYSINEVPKKNLIFNDNSFLLYKSQGFLILKVKDFKDNNFNDSFDKNILPKLNSKDLILDLRENKGGNALYGIFLLNKISAYQDYYNYDIHFRKNLEILSNNNRERQLKYVASEIINKFQQLENYQNTFFENNYIISDNPIKTEVNNYLNIENIYILSSKETASAGEDFIYFSKQNPNVTVLGETTKGSTGQVLEYNLSNGTNFFLTVYKCKGEEFINNIGVKPDYFVDTYNNDFNEILHDSKTK